MNNTTIRLVTVFVVLGIALTFSICVALAEETAFDYPGDHAIDDYFIGGMHE